MKLKNLKISSLELKNNILLAPLAGFTDLNFRKTCLKNGASLTFTEMISAKGLCYDNKKTQTLLNTCSEEKIKAVQLFGEDAYFLRKASEHECIQKFDIIDINMGCPVPKLFKNGEGSALLLDLNKASNIIKECKKSGKIMSVKFRTGINNGHEVTNDFAKMCENSGADMITIHGRTREMFYSGEVNYKEIEEAVKSVKIPVIGNGGIFDEKSAERMFDCGVEGIMLARGALEKPYLFKKILGEDYDIKKIILEHLHFCLIDDSIAYAKNMRKHIMLYMSNFKNGKKQKELINRCDSIFEFINLIENLEIKVEG